MPNQKNISYQYNFGNLFQIPQYHIKIFILIIPDDINSLVVYVTPFIIFYKNMKYTSIDRVWFFYDAIIYLILGISLLYIFSYKSINLIINTYNLFLIFTITWTYYNLSFSIIELPEIIMIVNIVVRNLIIFHYNYKNIL